VSARPNAKAPRPKSEPNTTPPTIAAEELGPMFDDRIASRLGAGTEFKLSGEDQRRRK